MGVQYQCKLNDRRTAVRTTLKAGKPVLNGIDFLEVANDQASLFVHFIHPLPGSGPEAVPAGAPLESGNLRITGGERVVNISPSAEPTTAENVLTVPVNTPGDFSTYTFSLVRSQEDGQPPLGFDPLLCTIEFSFKVDCPTDLDCRGEQVCPPDSDPELEIDYLAKDYASFRRLMLDRLAVLAPSWKDRSPADLGIALIELLAYAADYLSYQQDAVATEAYLNTARRRVSVRRHARLVDYPMHDGCNARTWVQVQVEFSSESPDINLPVLEKGVQLLTQIPGLPRRIAPSSDLHKKALESGAQVFELVHPVMALYKEHNEIRFYTWGERDCCLPKGATRATLLGHLAKLKPGDVLVFVERRGPQTGEPEDADPAHRWAIRLVEVKTKDDEGGAPLSDPLTGEEVTEIRWHTEDALPFPLCLSTGVDIDDVSVALGNIVLADHGCRLEKAEELEPVPAPRLKQVRDPLRPAASTCEPTASAETDRLVPVPARYRPQLKNRPVTQAAPYKHGEAFSLPASRMMEWSLQECAPQIQLWEEGNPFPWLPKKELLGSSPSATEFVVEIESDGEASLRFGDGCQGAAPREGARFRADYRTGNGTQGNIGHSALGHIVTPNSDILGATNPLPARGGMEPESSEHVRLHAPHAFRRQDRAVTPEDYSSLAQKNPQVQKATAFLRWTGSWHTVFLTVDRLGGEKVDPKFERDLRAYLEEYRLAQHDLEVDSPRLISLEIAMTICIRPDYFNSHVRAALLQVFSNRLLPGGKRGLFHPDNFTFGQTVYLSPLYSAAEAVPGVASVTIDLFQRQDQPLTSGLEKGRLELGRLEIARLDNDPNFPKHGVFRLTTQGGK